MSASSTSRKRRRSSGRRKPAPAPKRLVTLDELVRQIEAKETAERQKLQEDVARRFSALEEAQCKEARESLCTHIQDAPLKLVVEDDPCWRRTKSLSFGDVIKLLAKSPRGLQELRISSIPMGVRVRRLCKILAAEDGPRKVIFNFKKPWRMDNRGDRWCVQKLVKAVATSPCVRHLEFCNIELDNEHALKLARCNNRLEYLCLPAFALMPEFRLRQPEPDTSKLECTLRTLSANQNLRSLAVADNPQRFNRATWPFDADTLPLFAEFVRRSKSLVYLELFLTCLERDVEDAAQPMFVALDSLVKAAIALPRIFSINLRRTRLPPFCAGHVAELILRHPRLVVIDSTVAGEGGAKMEGVLFNAHLARLSLARRCYVVATVHALDLSTLPPSLVALERGLADADAFVHCYTDFLRSARQ